ncbi:nicotinate phosphoribosyltransferase [Desulfarculus baarsii DSM 2075]|uniref:Nicotinate phosphoribosyltransferase n=1 Tax=Desulfarculus baarsii (strain ATCC 33931 / DSM 2075 / LMG 7858 / VKM B-1802 / 2st14) TaxID=644282 RepID=E1QF78_DESB2|nr:nicotinate phosphoribosyltransferase [Desulfarculus baarsii]ADK84214.1 nicotinate phosphoribosyltransferase [Desulfarculus baarsii DSM 2075]
MRPAALALHTDFYQLTMAASYFEHGLDQQATFSLFAHATPPERGYMVAAGLEDCLEYLENFRFSAEEIDYLRSLGRFSRGFVDYLAGMRFGGEVWAAPEGTVFFAEEPILELSASLIEAQLVETFLVNTVNHNSTIAAKAARCQQAAAGRACVDFSLRRTMGLDAGFAAARSSAIAGFGGTSNVAAAMALGLKPVGTMAHSFIQAVGDEKNAFDLFAQTFPDHTVLLVDTYDTARGLARAVETARTLAAQGHAMIGVRLDSGDLAAMSRLARQTLDAAGLERALVMVSGNLDEYRIADLLAAGAPIDMFGVGTRMGASADQPYTDFTFKLVAYQGRPTLKLSEGKMTWAGAKQIYRSHDAAGIISGDELCLRHEARPAKALLQPMMQGGRRLAPPVGWAAAQQVLQAELASLPAQCRLIRAPQPLAPTVSPLLRQVQDDARQAALAK